MRTFRSGTGPDTKVFLTLIVTGIALASPTGHAEQTPSETDRQHIVGAAPATVESSSTAAPEPLVDEDTKTPIDEEPSDEANGWAQSVIEPQSVFVQWGAAQLTLADTVTAADAHEPLSANTAPVADGDESQDTDATPEGAAEQPPVAENVVLSEPFELPELSASDVSATESDSVAAPVAVELAPEKPQVPFSNEPIVLLGTTVPVGTSARLSWSPDQSFEGIAAPTPVLVVNGTRPGPTVCLTAAVHGDELNGIEIVRSVLYDLSPDKLSGTVIGVPIVNLQGFRRSSRYLPDRRDLNRYFPGNPTGSSASRIAHSFFREVISHCDALVDLHTGSFHRTNLPQLRADLSNPRVTRLTERFGSTVVLHSSGAKGTLRRAATDAGIPAVTLEAGEPTRVQKDAVSHGRRGIMTLLSELHMVNRVTLWGSREPVYYRSTWIRADQGGVLISKAELGQQVKRGDLLGTITDPITNVQSRLVASTSGRLLGMALNQFVMPGFAVYRLGIDESDHPIAITRQDSLDAEPDELAEEEEAAALNEDATLKAIDAGDYLEDSD